jgi:ABC-type Fe3+ transport system permease subunit
MSAARDPETLASTGELPFVVLAGALVAFPAAFLNLVAPTDSGTRWRVVLVYFAVYVPIAVGALARSPDLTVVQLVQHCL